MKDPLTLVYEELWRMLDSSSDFTAIVSKGNRIKFSGENIAPLKDQAITMDYPEVRIVTTSSTPHILRTSSGCSLKKVFSVQILTADQRVDAKLFPLEWIIYRELSKKYTNLSTLTWKGKEFVKALRVISVNDSLLMTDQTRPTIRGWVAVWSVEIEMWFKITDL